MLKDKLDKAIREVPDFPKPGIMFKDITPVLHDPVLCKEITDEICSAFKDVQIDAVVGVESRGFLFGMLIAQQLNVPFVTVRKKGKLPYDTVSYKYDLEYGSAEIEMHTDAIKAGDRVLIHDDLLATGGTAIAAAELVNMQNGVIGGFSFVIELEFLKGVQKLKPFSEKISNLISY
ncbi:MAG: adenine phosphoribosyltransferase [Salibacteraceae bacterium]